MSAPIIISASAGSGKTTELTERFLDRISKGFLKPSQVIATTFTISAANELKSRLREKLIEKGLIQAAQELDQALIGTVDAVCLQLIEDHALELGLSPKLIALEPAQQQTVIKEIVNDFIDDQFTELARRTGNDQVGFQDELRWVNHLNDLMSLSRSNMIDHIKLPQMAQTSFEGFWSHFPEAPEEDVDVFSLLLPLLEQFFEIVSTENDPETWTESAKSSYYAILKTYDSIRSGRFTWPEIANLSAYKFSKYGGENVIAEIQEVLNELHFDTQLRKDQANYTRDIFKLAKRSISAYQSYKSDRGLLDFVDMEVHFHQALENQSLLKSLANDYKLMMVDEFQDSSPLQVSIFQKMANVIDEAIWVGDPKQSIYAFRGADPDLFLNYVKSADREQLSTLGNSYRSREELVFFSNALFTEVFKKQLKPEQIQLTFTLGGRDWIEGFNEGFEHGLQHWNFTGGQSNQPRYVQLATQVLEEIESKRLVYDKEKEEYRPIQLSDIAVLCRTNSTIQSMSQALRSVGVPVITGGPGLHATPEAVVILALLKWLIAPKDTLAIAELWLFTELNGDQDALLDLRKANLKNAQWDMGHPFLQVLAKERSTIGLLTPQMQIEKLMLLLPLGQLMASWGDVESRLANVRQLISFADDYQQYAISSHQMISTGGYLSYIERLAEDQVDLVGKRSGNALKILTYHDSKGLEWPMVILWQLDAGLKTKLYSVRVESNDGFDAARPLYKRRLDFYTNPFNSEKVAGFHNHLDTALEAAEIEAVKEEQRLIYVACTRARDYLVLTGKSRKSSTENDLRSLKRLTTAFDPKVIEEQIGDKTFMDTGLKDQHENAITALYLDLPEATLEPLKSSASDQFFATASGTKAYAAKHALPSEQAPLLDRFTGAIRAVHDPIKVNELNDDVAEFGNSFHQIWCALFNWKNAEEKLEVINHNLLLFNQKDNLDSGEILKCFNQFESYLLEYYKPKNIHRELPISGEIDAVQYQGFIDLVIERDDDLILIDYKSFALNKWHESAYRKKALEYSGQLSIYSKLLEQSFDKPVSEAAIYFVVMGKIVVVDI